MPSKRLNTTSRQGKICNNLQDVTPCSKNLKSKVDIHFTRHRSQCKENEVGEAHGTHGRDKKIVQVCNWKTQTKETRGFGVNSKMILKWMLMKYAVIMCATFASARYNSDGRGYEDYDLWNVGLCSW